MVVYTGIFFDNENTKKLWNAFPPQLTKRIPNPHVTLMFRPVGRNQHDELFGTEVSVKIVGYAKDNNNEGVLVSVQSENEKLQALYSKLSTPHITLSVSTNGYPVNTANLDSEPCQELILTGTFKGFRG